MARTVPKSDRPLLLVRLSLLYGSEPGGKGKEKRYFWTRTHLRVLISSSWTKPTTSEIRILSAIRL